MNTLNKQKLLNLTITIFILLYVIMLLFIPKNLDDWTWGSHIGIERLKDYFVGYNGRYLGNILVIILVRCPVIVTALIEGAIVGCIYLCLNKILDKKYLILIFLVLNVVMPKNMFTQTFGWISGFSNYIFSFLSIMIYILFLKKYYDDRKVKILEISVWFVFGILSQLLVENSTIFFILAGIFTNLFYWFQNRMLNKHYFILFLSNIIGAIIMFQNSAYYNASVGSSKTYKDINMPLGSPSWFQSTWDKFTTQTLPYWFINNKYLMIVLGITAIIFVMATNIKYKKIFLKFYVFATLFFMYKAYSEDTSFYFEYDNSLSAIIYIVFCLSLVYCVIKGISNKKDRLLILTTLLAQPFLVFPLIISDPINARCFLSSYLMFALFIVEIIEYCIKEGTLTFIQHKKLGQYYNWIVYAVIIFTVLCMVKDIRCSIFLNHAANEKAQYIESQIEAGKKQITVPFLPFSNIYTVNVSPCDEVWQQNFNNYYHYPLDITYEYISYPEWKETIQ